MIFFSLIYSIIQADTEDTVVVSAEDIPVINKNLLENADYYCSAPCLAHFSRN